MNISILSNSTFVENLGWTLLHSVWQIALIALILFLALKILSEFSANLRYLTAVAALTLAVVLPVVTFVQSGKNSVTDLSQRETPLFKTDENDDRIAPSSEKFSSAAPPAFAPLIKSNENKFLAAIENLQKFCSENFSVVSPFVVGLWLLGVMLFALRLTGGTWRLRVYKTREISAPNDKWRGKFAALCRQLKITQTVKFLQSNLIETPVVIGWLKPVILVPTSIFLQISPAELETIIAHELVHVRRGDALVNFAQSFIEVLFFYHPCVWWISTVIRREREFAADKAVLEIMENSHIVYANALANLEEIRLLTKQTAPPVLVAANGGNLMQRIQKILQKNTGRKRGASAWSAILALAFVPAVLLLVFSFDSGAFVNAQATVKTKKMAIGFVSIPPNYRKKSDQSYDETARILIAKLQEHKIPAIGFVLGASISDGKKLDPAKAAVVRRWRDAGLEIGIGNYKHIWFYDTPFDEYAAGVEKNAAMTKQILAEKNLPLRYFSYPYLNTGKNAEEGNRFESWLQSQNLTSVKYTIDNQEWMYSYAYDEARQANDKDKMNRIRHDFLDYMSKMLTHYEAYSQEMFGRDISQTMVLTPSRLIADSADDLFGMIEKHGYGFVTMDEAQSDAAYQTPENFVGIKAGISWFERWQMAQGKKLRDEPKVNTDIEKIWEEGKPKTK